MSTERHGLCTVRLGYFLLLMQCLAHHGLDPERVYGPALVAELGRLDPSSFRPVEEWDQMMALAEQHSEGMDIAFKMAEFIKSWDTGLIGFMTMVCRNLREAFEALAQFYGLLNDVYALEENADGRHFRIAMKPLGAVQSPRLECLTLAIICRHARWLSSRPDLVFDVSFGFPEPAPEQVLVYRRTFGGKVSFGCAETVFTGPVAYASYPVVRGPRSVSVHDVLRVQLTSEMALLRESSSSFAHQLERVLAPRLQNGRVGLEDVAAELGVSSRTLQNRLEESGLTYRGMLDRMRHAQALACMGDADVSLIEIAQMLGFATQSSFQRAFKRWAGVAPGEYRRQKLRGSMPHPANEVS